MAVVVAYSFFGVEAVLSENSNAAKKGLSSGKKITRIASFPGSTPQLLPRSRVKTINPSLWTLRDCGEVLVRCAYATSLDNIKGAMVRLKRFVGKL